MVMGDTGGRDHINIGVLCGENCQESVDTLAEFQETLDGLLGRIHIAKHCIVLTALDVSHINSPLYCTGLKPRATEEA